jgi:hypothetical protein
MQVVLKYLAQFLLIPLFRELAKWLGDEYKRHKEAKELEREAKKQQEKYEQAPVEQAHDEFRKLP